MKRFLNGVAIGITVAAYLVYLLWEAINWLSETIVDGVYAWPSWLRNIMLGFWAAIIFMTIGTILALGTEKYF